MPCSLFSRHSAFPRPLALSVGGGRRTTPLTGSAAITATLLAIRRSLESWRLSYAIDYGAGKVGQAFIFDGFGLALELQSTENLQSQNFSVECWIKREDASLSTMEGTGTGYFFGFGSGGYGFGLHDDGTLFLAKVDDSEVDSSCSVADTNFHHVAITKSGANVAFYEDGVSYPAGLFSPGFTFTNSADIGAQGGTVNTFLGTVDELSIYSRALSATEIDSIYGARGQGKCIPPIPVIVSQPESTTLTAYYPADFTVVADGPVPLQYQWTFDGTNLNGATDSILSFSAALPSQAGTYSVIVGTPPNTTNSSNAVLSVTLPAAPTILTQPASHIGVAEDYTTFTVSAQSQAPVPMYYQWNWDGTNLPGATTTELVIGNLTLADAGTYKVQVSNPFFSTNSQPAVLTMIPAPKGTNHIVANLDPNELIGAIEAGGSVTFVCNGTFSLSQPIVPTQDVVVDGSNYSVALSGGGRSQILAIPAGINVTLRDLTLTGGSGVAGGAISNSGTLLLTDVILSSNVAQGAEINYGGALYNAGGNVTLQNVLFEGNRALGAWAYGGALYSIGGWLSGSDVQCSNNAAVGNTGVPFYSYPEGPNGPPGLGFGGALYVTNCIAVLSNGWFVSNSATCSPTYNEPPESPEGGALYNAGWTALTGIDFIGNSCEGTNGIDGIVLSGGVASGWPGGDGEGGIGGAVYNAGLLMMTNCEFGSNTVTGGSGGQGGYCTQCTPPGNGPNGAPGNALGGALANFGTATVVSNTFLENSAIGPGYDIDAVYSVSDLEIDTNTIPPGTFYIVSNAFAPFLVLSPQSQIAPVESTVTFTALAVGDPAPTYQWAWDGTNLASATNPTFILPNFQSGDSGTYWVTVSSSSGSETSAPVKLTVEGPAITVTVASEKNGDIVINVYAVPVAYIVLESSIDLLDWQSLQTNSAPFTFVDTNAPGTAHRFYRAIAAH